MVGYNFRTCNAPTINTVTHQTGAWKKSKVKLRSEPPLLRLGSGRSDKTWGPWDIRYADNRWITTSIYGFHDVLSCAAYFFLWRDGLVPVHFRRHFDFHRDWTDFDLHHSIRVCGKRSTCVTYVDLCQKRQQAQNIDSQKPGQSSNSKQQNLYFVHFVTILCNIFCR